jgi:hypothetical protein
MIAYACEQQMSAPGAAFFMTVVVAGAALYGFLRWLDKK